MDNRAELFIEYKGLLFSIAYNMLGSVDTAEDIVQEAFLKWMETPEGTVRHAKAYLVKIVTNTCINYLNSARVKREEYIGVWLPEPLVNYDSSRDQARIETYHALSIGVMVLLEKLTPQERAIFLLKEIFAYDYYELAGIFDKTEDNCRQIFKRAKGNLGKDTHRFEVDLRVHEKMLNKLLQATSEGNLEDLIELLKEDIVLFADGAGKFIQVKEQRLTAAYKPIHGRENVCRLIMSAMSKLYEQPGFRQEVIIANGMPSFVSYLGDTPISLFSVETDGEQIRNIYIQTNPDKLKQFRK
ncbi:RNA polymerase sigma factor SigJ [Pseudoflavitalea sp. X16]|uniref:RNA polymerase sigma factor SigJ n=1 Tax=Paraflavitalea devenefica TaxID=2716334 RepID=UPI0014224A38|nr:RNA polymerase sigma factor SigJ [Paraflavitalea devenefica]NII26579.1 RNA polymerase sigma factor SigJ [Paraflavitalea devenefica]